MIEGYYFLSVTWSGWRSLGPSVQYEQRKCSGMLEGKLALLIFEGITIDYKIMV